MTITRFWQLPYFMVAGMALAASLLWFTGAALAIGLAASGKPAVTASALPSATAGPRVVEGVARPGALEVLR